MLRSRFVYFQVIRGSIVASVAPHDESVTELTAALEHPRTLMGDYAGFAAAFRTLLRKLGLGAWYQRKPWALVHLPEPTEGGYTPVELRAFREAAMEAGCSSVWMLGSREPPLSRESLEEVRAIFDTSSWWPF